MELERIINFGHPSSEVLIRLEEINSKIYRTDINGEIILKVNKKRKNQNENTYKIDCILLVFLVNNSKRINKKKEMIL